MFYDVFYSQYFHKHTRSDLAISLPQSSIRKPQTILNHAIFNNYPFLAYILYFLNNLKRNYIVLIILKSWWHSYPQMYSC